VRTMQQLLPALALVAAAGSSSCTTYRYVEKELHLRYDAASDELELLEIQRGLCADDVGKARTALSELATGARRIDDVLWAPVAEPEPRR